MEDGGGGPRRSEEMAASQINIFSFNIVHSEDETYLGFIFFGVVFFFFFFLSVRIVNQKMCF